MTKPFKTATPDKAMKPIPADIDKGMSLNHKKSTPPVRANGTPVNTNKLSLMLWKTAISKIKIVSNASGITICIRACAEAIFSN